MAKKAGDSNYTKLERAGSIHFFDGKEGGPADAVARQHHGESAPQINKPENFYILIKSINLKRR